MQSQVQQMTGMEGVCLVQNSCLEIFLSSSQVFDSESLKRTTSQYFFFQENSPHFYLFAFVLSSLELLLFSESIIPSSLWNHTCTSLLLQCQWLLKVTSERSDSAGLLVFLYQDEHQIFRVCPCLSLLLKGLNSYIPMTLSRLLHLLNLPP